ncbi:MULTISPECIES: YbjQ family protein [unclassified Corynebacterium]|uniref:YbjQ family protein n=1 Tax=unclassified Corynebacterium TaxID=2624378 RepID=UPI002653762D|nr:MULTISPECIES: YbjQ family protein [unclassified Corynebacterium]MDN8594346.1 YbjQ family protein [Corynebacterium sp. P4_F2]WKK55111.1 YbjQ family protein [Corynebacterium sp. P4-C1]
MILTTTQTVEDREIIEYMRIIGGETITGMNMFKDIGAGFRNMVGGRASSWEQELIQARDSALNELWERARQIGADAVVGVELDYSPMGADGSMMLVAATGTAVRLD